jgi:hypothetical protein
MAKRRKDQFWDLVKDGDWTPSQEKMLKAICTIVAEATKSASKARKETQVPAVIGPQELHQRLLNEASEHVNVETYDKRSFSRCGATLRSISDLRKDDLDTLIVWLERGGVSWMDTKPTWSQVIKHLPDWISRARAEYGDAAEVGNTESRFR